MTDLRVRVRPVTKVDFKNRAQATVQQECLSVPHMGEALDAATDVYRMRTCDNWTRVLHYGHKLNESCTGERCVFVDYVPKDTEKDADELAVEGMVAKVRAS